MKICGGTEGIICGLFGTGWIIFALFGTGWTIYGQGGLFDLAVERSVWYEKHPNLCRVQMNSLLQNLSEEVITDWPETKDPLVTTFKSTVKHCQYCHKDTIARVNLVSHVLKRVENCDRVRCKLHSPVLLVPHVRAENSFKKDVFILKMNFWHFFMKRAKFHLALHFSPSTRNSLSGSPSTFFRILFSTFSTFFRI